MKAILLAAGYGTRLKPLTDKTPKCLVSIKGRPLLGIWFEQLTSSRINKFLVNTHYLSEQVESYVRNSPYRNSVTLVYEPELCGTAGTLLRNLSFFDGEDVMLIHADNYGLINVGEFILAHKNRPPECLLTMMTFRSESPSSCGIVELDNRGVVIGFHEKVDSPPGNSANAAIYILSKELIEIMISKFSLVTDFSTEVLPLLMDRIYTYETNDYFIDIGTPEAYEVANSICSS